MNSFQIRVEQAETGTDLCGGCSWSGFILTGHDQPVVRGEFCLS